MAYAGISCGDFNTATEVNMIKNTGYFIELTGSKYTSSSNYLCTGDILVTKTKGHTVVVLSDGPYAERKAVAETVSTSSTLGSRVLSNGCSGDDVKEMQTNLIALGYSCGSWGADGDFGDATELAVKQFQRDHDLGADGEFGPLSYNAMLSALKMIEADNGSKYVLVVGGSCYIRTAPRVANGNIINVAKEGTKLVYKNQMSENGWFMVEYNGQIGWMSGKYGRLTD